MQDLMATLPDSDNTQTPSKQAEDGVSRPRAAISKAREAVQEVGACPNGNTNSFTLTVSTAGFTDCFRGNRNAEHDWDKAVGDALRGH